MANSASDYNFDAVKDESPASVDVLCVTAFLALDAIPYEILIRCPGYMSFAVFEAMGGVSNDPNLVDDLLRPLTRRSLIRQDPAARIYAMPREVQLVIQEGLNADDSCVWAVRAMRAITYLFPDPLTSANWPLCEKLLPHALLCAEHIQNYDIETDEAARLLYFTASYMKERGQHAAAEPLFRRAMSLYEKDLKPGHASTAQIRNLMELYRVQINPGGVEPPNKQVLAIDEELLGPEHRNTAASLNYMANQYCSQGNYIVAEALYKRVLEIRETILGPEHSDTTATLSNYVNLLRGMGRDAEAAVIETRAAAGRAKHERRNKR